MFANNFRANLNHNNPECKQLTRFFGLLMSCCNQRVAFFNNLKLAQIIILKMCVKMLLLSLKKNKC